jgi:glycosyltransferase involved in cell wall biosynthesis
VRIAEICLQKAPEIRFVLIGDGSEREAISSVANQAGVLNRNFFMLGALPKRELPAWFSAATLTVALFTGPRIVWKDAVQNKFFDSLAAGRPIASNHLGWQTEIALRAGCGIVMDPDDAIAGAQTVISALGNDAWINSARTAARLLARERFDRDILAGQLEKTFLAVLNRSTS